MFVLEPSNSGVVRGAPAATVLMMKSDVADGIAGWLKDDLVYARVLRARDAVIAALEAVQQAQDENAKPAWQRAMGG